jgi:hypothetical protein
VAFVRAALAAAVFTIGLGACSVVEGLSSYSKENCGQGCEQGADVDAAPQGDGGPEKGPDAGSPDVWEAGSAPDSAGGCGTPDTVDNCGACGVKCNKTTGTPSCAGATCTYVCAAGHSNCNASSPDTDGCECATPGCCGTGCETTHTDGVGQAYFDCNPRATYTEAAAFAACTAYAKSVGSSGANCVGPLTCTGSSVPTVCFTTSGGQCASYCWQYTGVYADGGPGTVWDCACPAHVMGSWN